MTWAIEFSKPNEKFLARKIKIANIFGAALGSRFGSVSFIIVVIN